ncbi:MAG TPA: hypothetical protein VE819_04990 [Steroidobacteraceae bacterium]|jgi:hypothetical protein|nr:hypothetical protein [Steroidobacteraceae bacterium]
MSVITPREVRAQNLRTLTVLAALFLLPLALAFFIYYGTGWRPSAHVNHGQLIAPARALPAVALPHVDLETPGDTGTERDVRIPAAAAPAFGKNWALVYIGAGDCDASCRESLYVMRQTRLALNNDMTRVARVLLVSGACCDRAFLAREHAGLQVLDASGPAARPLLAQFPSANREHSLFIVDPLGNLVMSYDARGNPRGLLEDLKKLLALSHIG